MKKLLEEYPDGELSYSLNVFKIFGKILYFWMMLYVAFHTIIYIDLFKIMYVDPLTNFIKWCLSVL